MDTAGRSTSFDKWRAVLLALVVHAVALTTAALAWSWPGSLLAPSSRVAMQATLIIAQAPEPSEASAAVDAIEAPRVSPLPSPAAPSVANDSSAPASPAIDHEQAKPARQHHPDPTAPTQPAAIANPTAEMPAGLNAPVAPPVDPPVEEMNAPTNINELRGWYAKEVRRTAYANWTPTGVPDKIHCHVVATQEAGGKVTDIQYDDCPFDPAARDTVERALHATQLPYEGFEVVFMHRIAIDFCRPEADCVH